MELKERIAVIIAENHLKQKELAAIMGVTESYVSTLLSGRRSTKLSTSVANLIEEKLGYNAQWVLTGEEPKFKNISKNPNISDTHRRVIMMLEKMSDAQIRAVLAFMNSLEEVEKSIQVKAEQSDKMLYRAAKSTTNKPPEMIPDNGLIARLKSAPKVDDKKDL